MSSPRCQIELLPRRRHDDFCGVTVEGVRCEHTQAFGT